MKKICDTVIEGGNEVYPCVRTLDSGDQKTFYLFVCM